MFRVCNALNRQNAALLAAVLAGLTLGGCAAPSSYMGISFAPGAAARDIQQRARRAQAGDKQAQLDLGIRLEEGIGIASDPNGALILYKAAASDSGGTKLLYIPASRNAPAMTVPFYNGPRKRGIPAAAEEANRLERILSRKLYLKIRHPTVKGSQ